MGLINAKPRFAVDEESGQIYDYATNAMHAPNGHVEDEDGVWDMEKVNELIRAGKPIGTAFTHKETHEALAKAHEALSAAHARIEGEEGANSIETEALNPDKVEQANINFQRYKGPEFERKTVGQTDADGVPRPGAPEDAGTSPTGVSAGEPASATAKPAVRKPAAPPTPKAPPAK